MNALIELKDVTAGYGKDFHLRGINIKVREHGITGLIGPNGSGKTTMLKTIGRILKPESGNVYLEGSDIWKMGIREFSKKAAVISQYIEAVSIPVFDYVMMGRIPYRREFQLFDSAEDMKKTEHYIGQTGIDPIKNKRLDSISGGEAQMAQFARALNQEPVLLLMDEPTSHLDIKHQSGILDLTKKYNRETGLTIIMAIHDLNLAAEYCDELILMKNGTVRYSGIPSEILNYRTIEEIYETVVIVEKNPVSHKPHVFLVPGDLL